MAAMVAMAATAEGRSVPESIPASLVVEALKDTFREARAALAAEVAEPPRHDHLGWILSVPDTHQRTVLTALDKEDAIRVVTCATEDEATAAAAGLHIGGEPVVLMIQHAGLYASINTLRGVAIDGRIPVFYMIGLLSREPERDPRESRHSMVRYCEPLLDTFGVPHARLEGPDDLHLIGEYYRLSRTRRGPTAVLVGLATA
jgi:sulfopyruvate decarboxylase TPP-binding subunit